jgi:glycerol-3-phosphate dehydrogenase subunit C
MTTTYDPAAPSYLDEADLRAELERVFDLCHGCRLCFNLCPSFPTLFELIDAKDGAVSALSASDHDRVIDECYQCKLCYVKCPYVPPHEWALDFPRLMTRAHAVRKARGHDSLKEKLADQFLGRSDLLGTVSSAAAPLVNTLSGKVGSWPRKLLQATVGIHADRLLPPYARERFSTWFSKRRSAVEDPRAEVAVFPTCFVEYMEPGIGKDLVRVLEHNAISCMVPEGTRCCGAPWLHSGDLARFAEVARRNVAALAKSVRAGREVLVSQPTCSYVVRKDYPIYAPGPDADLVAAHTFDAAEYLVGFHRKEEEGGLSTEFSGEVPAAIAYHLACHLRAQSIGYKGRDLLQLTGARVVVVERCSGIDGTWGYREENYELARKVARPLVRELSGSGVSAFCGDCHLANTAILQETGIKPSHPVQVLARAYGISEDAP